MKKVLFFMMGLMLTAIVGCSNDKSDESLVGTEKESPSEAQVAEEVLGQQVRLKLSQANLLQGVELPDWLVKVIEEREAEDAKIGVKGNFSTPIYQFSWKGEKFYFVYDNYDSCVTCNSVFHLDGTMYKWSVTEIEDFVTNSTDWACIYKPES
jgi:hypothetical protein